MKTQNFCQHCGCLLVPESEVRHQVRNARENGLDQKAEALVAGLDREKEQRERDGK